MCVSWGVSSLKPFPAKGGVSRDAKANETKNSSREGEC